MNHTHNLGWYRIAPDSYVDGPGGPRTVLWAVGCPVRCPGCQNTHLWEHDWRTRYDDPQDLACLLLEVAVTQPLTITGGEPLFQAEALRSLLLHIHTLDRRAERSRRHVILYSGYVWEDLLVMSEAVPAILGALSHVDVLVDGPYDQELDDDALQWRGSRNQRVIDVRASITNGAFYGRDLVLLDWDTPTVTIPPGPGHGLLGAAETMRALFPADALRSARRCGHV